ncbi:hypothetical protein WH47_12636 [Habropoda laboriosa]|uniref:Uncharacterized protein n=1 Tax=Habropoda laboriosa TaxID=597456 RepID=A0A0L7R7T0_9HYME|nr:hypothetical protein WH47_12636 [Habropoda laboriosa]
MFVRYSAEIKRNFSPRDRFNNKGERICRLILGQIDPISVQGLRQMCAKRLQQRSARKGQC